MCALSGHAATMMIVLRSSNSIVHNRPGLCSTCALHAMHACAHCRRGQAVKLKMVKLANYSFVENIIRDGIDMHLRLCPVVVNASAHNVTYKDIFDYVHSNGKCLFFRRSRLSSRTLDVVGLRTDIHLTPVH